MVDVLLGSNVFARVTRLRLVRSRFMIPFLALLVKPRQYMTLLLHAVYISLYDDHMMNLLSFVLVGDVFVYLIPDRKVLYTGRVIE